MLTPLFSPAVFNVFTLGSKTLRLFYFELTLVTPTWVERRRIMTLNEIELKS